MIARVAFRGDHPAVPFLLMLAIADDALGLVILAFFYPSAAVSLPALAGLLTAALASAFVLRRRGTRSFWAYVLGPGALAWAGLYLGGIHPALALVPIVPWMPHGRRDLGLFDAREEFRPDTLSRFEHWWKIPVQFVLLLFGFANAGVPFEEIGPGTFYVLAGLQLGKPIGIFLFSVGARRFGARLPAGFDLRDLLLVGVAASVGFTVALFFATAAFPAGTALSETKMGALLSFAAAPLTLVVAALARRRSLTPYQRDTAPRRESRRFR
jgi:NhaA family Na+:H+ antiporter